MPKKKVLLLGAHMSIAGGFYKAIERGESIQCTCIQIFTKSNRQWHAKEITQQDIDAFIQAKKQSSLIKDIVAHASYLINIGSPKEETEQKSIAALQEELKRCEQLEIPYLILHPGAHLKGTVDECLNRISNNLDIVLKNTPGKTMILLENTAGQGTNVGYTFEQLATIYDKAKHKARIGFCFDTCHAFAAGYNISTKNGYEEMWKKFESIIGLKNLKAIHVNDSLKPCGSRVDRHADIGKGKIGLEGFKLLFNDPRFFDTPKILETPKEHDLKDDIKNMETLKKLITEKTKGKIEIL